MNNGRSKKESRATYSPNVKTPSRNASRLNRGTLGLILSILLPPVGLLFLWRNGVFRTRGRMVITALATLEMLLLFVWTMPRQELATISPAPATPARVTHAPESEVLTALSNIDQLLYQQQLDAVVAQGGDETDLMTDEEREALRQQEQEAILNTTVYCVYDNAVYYHASSVCGNQSNRRELTVREALSEGLQPCTDCNPPVYAGGES